MGPFRGNALSRQFQLCGCNPGNGRVLDAVAPAAWHAREHVPLGALVLRMPSMPTYVYSPNWRPDITLIHGARRPCAIQCRLRVCGNTCCPDCGMPLATAIAATAMKHARYR